MKNLIVTVLVLIGSTAYAQKGIIKGVVKDKTTNEEIIGANVFIEGTTTGAATDVFGAFQFQVESGTYNLVATFIGYANFKLTELTVAPGEEVNLTIMLQTDDVQLEEVVVVGQADKTAETVLLLERKNAVEFKQSIGAQELTRKGVGDAQSAVTKITGVSKQEGVKNVFVRGLGDRYNSTSLNGLPLPSEDPEYKNISLEFFASDIINSIDVNKTFNPSLYGDVDGANINIISKELFEDQELKVSASAGVNSAAMGKTFLTPDGTNYFGTGLNSSNPLTDLTKYDFENGFKPNTVSNPVNSSFSVSGGKRFNLGGRELSMFLVGSMQNEYVYKEGLTRSAVSADGGAGRDFKYVKYDYNTAQIAMGNFTYRISDNANIAYNSMFIHNSNQNVGEYRGQAQNLTEVDGRSALVRRQQVNNNNLFVNQLISDIKISDRLQLDISGSFNTINGSEPDRRTNTFLRDDATDIYTVASGSAGLNHRFFSELSEKDLTAKASLEYKLSADTDKNSKFRIGYSFRNTQRDFEFRQFSFDFNSNESINIDNPDVSLFNQYSMDQGTFRLVTTRGFNQQLFDVFAPDTYNGDRTIHAINTNFDIELSSKLVVGVGARFEQINQEVIWDFNQDRNTFGNNLAKRDPNYILPSLNAKYSLTDDNIVRFSASQSYTFPQFKEVAPFLYEDINFSSFGNPDLRPAKNFNFDLKYEKYIGRNGLFAVTGFYKHIEDAINRVLVTSAATELSYVNTGNADVTGIEIEIQKDIWNNFVGDRSKALSVGANVSYLQSKQELKDDDRDNLTVLFTKSEDQLEGASPVLINADITFVNETEKSGFTTTIVFNYFSERIHTLGTADRQNIVQKAVPTLDFISSYKVNRHFNIDFKAKNILNPDYELAQGVNNGEDVEIQNFKRGVNVSLGLTYKF